MTPQNIASWKAVTDGDPEMIDGLEELPQDMQDKITRALEQGHVDDEDWKGDVEKNRPGQKGYRTPKKKEGQEDDVSNVRSRSVVGILTIVPG